MSVEDVKESDVEKITAAKAVAAVCAMIILIYCVDLLHIMHKAATHVLVLKSLQWLMILGFILLGLFSFITLLYLLYSVVKYMFGEPKIECRKLEITLVSADSLPNIRRFGLMKVYAKISIPGESITSCKKTPVDMEREINPKWNFTIDYVIRESTIQQSDIKVAIKLFCKKSFREDGFIGEVNIPVKSLFDMGLKSDEIISYQVGGTSNGKLNILYSFGEPVLVQKQSAKGLEKGSKKGSKKRFWWRNGMKVLLEGVIHMLGDNDDDNDDGCDFQVISRDVHVDEDDSYRSGVEGDVLIVEEGDDDGGGGGGDGDDKGVSCD